MNNYVRNSMTINIISKTHNRREPTDVILFKSIRRRISTNTSKIPLFHSDYFLGISLGKQTAGYALLNQSGKPIKLGLIDLKNLSSPLEKASEIIGVSSLLKNSHYNHHIPPPSAPQNAALNSNQITKVDPTWIIAIEQHTRNPFLRCQAHQTSSINKALGIIEYDCSKLFKTSPICVPPQDARKLIGSIYGQKIETREKLYEFACSMITSFPSVKNTQGKILAQTFHMSDAWVVALYSKIKIYGELLKQDPSFMTMMEKVINDDKRIIELRMTLKNPIDSKMELELTEVLGSRIEKLRDSRIQHLLRKKHKSGSLASK